MKVDEQLERVIRFTVANQISRERQKLRPPRLTVIDGPGGVGKSEGVKKAASDAGADVSVTTGGRIGGETEIAGVGVFDKLLLGCADISRLTGNPGVCLIEDADLSIFVTKEHREYTVDTDATVNFVQYVCDNRDQYVDATGAPIALIFTGNDFRGLRETLRQRAIFYTHNPSWRDTAAIFERIIAPTTAYQRRCVRALVRKYKTMPLRFFVDVASAASARNIQQAIAGSGPLDPEAIDKAVIAARDDDVNIHELFRVAQERSAATTPRSFISDWR